MGNNFHESPPTMSDEEIISEAVDFMRRKYEAAGLNFDKANEETWAEIMDLAHKVGESQTARNRMDNLVSQGFQVASSRVETVHPSKNNTSGLAHLRGLSERAKKRRK